MSITPGKFKPSIQVLQIFQIMSTLGQGEGLDPTLLTHCPPFPSISKGCCVCVCGGGRWMYFMLGHGTFPETLSDSKKDCELSENTLPGRSYVASPFSSDCFADVPLRIRH